MEVENLDSQITILVNDISKMVEEEDQTSGIVQEIDQAGEIVKLLELNSIIV